MAAMCECEALLIQKLFPMTSSHVLGPVKCLATDKPCQRPATKMLVKEVAWTMLQQPPPTFLCNTIFGYSSARRLPADAVIAVPKRHQSSLL